MSDYEGKSQVNIFADKSVDRQNSLRSVVGLAVLTWSNADGSGSAEGIRHATGQAPRRIEGARDDDLPPGTTVGFQGWNGARREKFSTMEFEHAPVITVYSELLTTIKVSTGPIDR